MSSVASALQFPTDATISPTTACKFSFGRPSISLANNPSSTTWPFPSPWHQTFHIFPIPIKLPFARSCSPSECRSSEVTCLTVHLSFVAISRASRTLFCVVIQEVTMRYLFAVSFGWERTLVIARAIWDVVVVIYGSLPESVIVAVRFFKEVPRRPIFKVYITDQLISVQLDPSHIGTQSNKGPLPTAVHENSGCAFTCFSRCSITVALGLSLIYNSGRAFSIIPS